MALNLNVKTFMKLLKKINRKALFLLTLGCMVVLFLFNIANYALRTHTIPECRSVVKLKIPSKGEVKESLIILNIVNVGDKKAVFYLRGYLKDGDKKHPLSRRLTADYKYENGFYYFSVKDVKINPIDLLSDEDISDHAFLINSEHFVLQVKEIFNGGYVFSGLRAPLFICSTY